MIEDWVSTLLEEQPEVIAIHGRTLAQMYRGQADWDAIRRAAKLVRETSTLVLGNGDLVTMSEVVQRVRETQVHGVLIGRGALGNPWLFRAKAWARQQLSTPTAEAPSLDVAVRERCQVSTGACPLLRGSQRWRAVSGHAQTPGLVLSRLSRRSRHAGPTVHDHHLRRRCTGVCHTPGAGHTTW